ncbi:MAG: single-stranded-DNA-specific exonuclease RecJ [Chloroflexota bacterium]|nr:single-stranded-DNA-specific exonuclease RecJ [Chloroflexota bacterium]
MPVLKKRWVVKDPITKEQADMLVGYPRIIQQILVNRGHETREAAERFLYAAIPSGSDPLSMVGIREAVTRIKGAISNNERIAVYGDYDVDGVTATALLTEVLEKLGADVEGYIPNRFNEGYGLNKEALKELHDQGKTLVITVDCGIRSPREVEYAAGLGLDIIISDHHHPSDELPQAAAIINPKQSNDNYPNKELAGVGLAYKLASALSENQDQVVEGSLDLVALGTVADLAPLVDENRALVRAGLRYIREPHRQGLSSLIGVSRLDPHKITARDIGFVLGPRLNAAGRLDTAYAALELLMAKNVALAAKLAQMLDNQNRERREITREVQEHAEQQALDDDPDAMLLFAADPSYNMGVVGLAASRLVDRFYRPSIVAFEGEEYTRGSCRSIPEFHITDALDRCADLLVRHGGHAAAAGFTIRNQNLPEFKLRLRELAEVQLADQDLRPTVTADLELPLSELNPDLLEYLNMLEPTGQGNPQARFISRNLIITRYKTVGRDGSHLKFSVTDGKKPYDAIAFRLGEWAKNMPPRVDLLYTFEENEYQGRKSLQLNVKDMRPSET